MKKKLLTLCLLAATFFTYAQNVGIGTITPRTRLHVTDSSVLFSAPGNLPVIIGNPPISGEGRRMMWYADKGAMRVGYVAGANWDKDSIGAYTFSAGYDTKTQGTFSVAFGQSTIASGNNALASGYLTKALGYYSTALGSQSTANATYSIAMGYSNTANGHGSVALGSLNLASGVSSLALGQSTTASGAFSSSFGSGTIADGQSSTAMGFHASASGYASTGMGIFTFATGYASTAMGYSTSASGQASTSMGHFSNAFSDYSIAIGESVTANSWISTALGRHNDPIVASPTTTWVATEPLLIIGNGTGPGVDRSNAMVILKNGNVGIGTSNPDHLLDLGNRMRIRSGGSLATSAGIWLNKTDNSAVQAFMGVENDTYVGFYGSVSGWSLGMNTVTGDVKVMGRLGIGIVAPRASLGFSSGTGQKISFYDNGNPAGLNYGIGLQSGLLQVYTDGAASDIAFGHGSSNSLTERMRIINNVGYDGMILNGRLVLKNGSADLAGGGGGVWLYKADNSALLCFMGTQNNQNIGFYGGAPGWGFIYDAVNGRVGIGTSAPLEKLEVNGNIKCIALTQTSDSRLKKGIVRIQNSLQKIAQLNGYNYYWKNETPDNRLQTGVLAQEVQKLFPGLVKEDKEGMLSVNYSGLIPVLIESIKEQQHLIEKQQLQIDELKRIVENLVTPTSDNHLKKTK